MTISTTYTPNAYAGDGSTTSFAVTFAFLSDADNLKVSLKDNTTGVVTVQTSSTHYNVSGSNVVFVTAPASGKTVLVELDPSYLQESDYRENGSLPAEVLEADLDLLKLESQLNKEKADAALRLDPVVAATLTSNIIVASNTPLTNAGKFVRFNAAGTGFEVQTLSATAGLGDVIDDVTPQLGGDLDLNGSDITGTGNIDITGIVSATSIAGGTPVLGTADEVQLRVKGHSTQTANILEVRNNADGLSLGVDTSGNAYINGNITVGGTVDGRDIAADGSALDALIAAPPASAGVSENIAQAAHGLAVGDVVRLSGAGTYAKAQADSAANAEVIGVVSAVEDVDNFTVLVAGKISGLSGLTANTVYFLSAGTAGALTSTQPSSTGEVSKPVLISDSTTSGYILTHRGAVIGNGPATAASQAEMEAATSTDTYVTPASAKHHPGVAKAWVNLSGTGTAAIRSSYNVTSITDEGTGDYTIYFTVDMANANYVTVATGQNSTSPGVGYSSVGLYTNSGAQGVGYVRVNSTTAGGSLLDYPTVSVVVFGNQ
jgi:hypothetical protein